MKIAFCDDFHVNERNFASLYAYLRDAKVTPQILIGKSSPEYSLIKAEGSYSPTDERLATLLEEVATWSPSEIRTYKEYEVVVYDLIRGELLAACLASDHWHRFPRITQSDDEVFELLLTHHRDKLMLCLAAGLFWLRYWHNRRSDFYANDYVVCFSGSLIYSRALVLLCRYSKAKAMVVESFFTGNDYYFDELYEPLPNNASIKNQNVWSLYRNQYKSQSLDVQDRDTVKAINKLLAPANKNVKQPPPSNGVRTKNAYTVLIALQVVNDFSIIWGGHGFVSSITLYKEAILAILRNTNFNVAIKGHPWERKKSNVGAPYTVDTLQQFVSTLNPKQQSRVTFYEDSNLRSLIQSCDAFFSICSQSALEAALFGLKPIVFNSAFFAKRGFTTDIGTVPELVNAVKDIAHHKLTFPEYRSMLEYSAILFEHYLVSCFPSGLKRLKDRTTKYSKIALEKTAQSEMSLVTEDNQDASDAVHAAFTRELVTNPTACRLLSRKIVVHSTSYVVNSNGTFLNLYLNNDYGAPLRKVDAGTSIYISYRVVAPDGNFIVKSGMKLMIDELVDGFSHHLVPINTNHLRASNRIRLGIIFEGVRWVMFGDIIEVNADTAEHASPATANSIE